MGPMPHPEPGPWAPRRRPGLLAGVLLAHALLLLGWHFELVPRLRGVQPATQATALVWLQIAPATPAAPQAAPTPAATTAPPRRAEARPEHPPGQPIAAPATPPEPTPATQPATNAIHLPTPEPAAGASAPPRERLMDSAATRAAIRQAGRTALLSERAASAIDQPWVSPRDGEARAIARSAKGDCLKGEFGGAGMGLLSVPFFVVAELRGQCAR